ncbi:hypothetical protein ACJJIF_15040 [Microbulbifer sp. SSSA002]|uniref:hypothetical protein n=1 Tax=Microbulbifer sp. SSSA002 TaxID=3243376 RepID=UPI004039FEE6
MLENIDKSIGSKDSGWQEYSVELAAAALDELDDKAWGELTKSIKGKPKYWRVRCAEALYESESKRCMELLAQLLLLDEEKEVAVVAACAIEDSGYELTPEYKPRIEWLLSRISQSCETSYEDVERLLRRFKPS